MKRFLTHLLLTVTTLCLYAQKAPIKFGKVSQEELEMTIYEPDTSAAAIVLCKYGRFNSNDFSFKRIERIKVLKKQGTQFAEFTLPGREDDVFRGRTYNLVDGEVEVTKLKRESIFKERVTDNYYRFRVALPNVKEGSVFEIELSSLGLPSEWAFQREIPVKHCELILDDSPNITFRKKMIGFEPLSIATNRRFVAQQMPAFKSEAFMSSKNNYITKFEFDILSVNFPGYYKSYTTSWEAVNDRLLDHTYFGGSLRSSAGYMSDITKEIEAKNLEPLEKAKAAFEAIKSVNWNESVSFYTTSTNLNKAFKDKVGNSTDINFMLLQLFKKLNIKAYPVVISTRKNGMLNTFYPSYEKLNYTLACAIIDNKEYLLDATEKELSFGMLPVRCLNQQGRLVNEQEGKWIDINSKFKDQETIFYELSLDDNLTLDGKISYNRNGYSAYNFRQDYKDYSGNEDYLTTLEEKFTGLLIKDFAIENIDNTDATIKDTYNVEIKNKAERIGDMIAINPFLFEKIKDNPFKLEERKYPVDFAYLRKKYMISNITVPNGYMVSELPKPIRIVVPDKSLSVLIQYQQQNNKVTTIYKFSINKTVFLPEEYAHLKTLYEQIIKKHAEPIILKPNTDAASL